MRTDRDQREHERGAESDNRVFLRGVLAAPPQQRTLPSGDRLCTFRLTVARTGTSRARVDSLECSTTATRVRRSLQRLGPGDRVEVHGSVHRRFWRGPSGVASRYEIAVSRLRLTARRRSGASPGRTRASA